MAEALGVVSSVISIIQVAQTVVQYVSEAKDASGTKEKLLQEIQGAVKILEVLTDLDLASQATLSRWTRTFYLLQTPLEQFRDSLTELEKRFAPTNKFGRVKEAFKWPFQSGEVNRILESLERQKSLFILALQRDEILLSAAIADSLNYVKIDIEEINHNVAELKIGIEQEQSRLDTKEHAKVVKWLSPLNFWTQQADINGRAQSGTGQWLLGDDRFLDWLDGECDTLWCPGIPGAGKTVLASIVVQALHALFTEEVGIGWVYFNYNENASQTIENLLSSLLGQLVQRNPVISDEILASYKAHASTFTRPPATEIVTLLEQEILRFKKVYFVIDALDECPTHNRRREIFVSELQRLVPDVHILFTSRPLDEIKAIMPPADVLEIRARDEDVEMYLEKQIQQETRLQRHIQAEPSLHQQIITAILQVADGMFLMARLHLDSIARLDNRRSIRRALQQLPGSYAELYNNAMKRIQGQELEAYARALQVLTWLSYAKRPLTVRALQHALSVERGDTELYQDGLPEAEDLISICAGLVTIDPESEIIRFVHYTTRQYFNELKDGPFANGHEAIASTCLTYLSFDCFSVQCVEEQEKAFRYQEYPFYLYAAEFWALHVVEGGHEKLLRARILAFLEDGKRFSAEEAMLHHRTSVWGYWMTGPLTDRSFSLIRKDPPLHTAAVYGLVDTIAHLVNDQGYSLEQRNRRDQTPLHRAAEIGQAKSVQRLLNLGSDVSATLGHARLGHPDALFLATHGTHATPSTHLETMKVLLSHDADAGYQEPENNLTALHIAARMNLEATKLLLKHGADVNTKLRRQTYSHSTAPELGPLTCLHLAILETQQQETLQRVQILIQYGIDINAQTGKGNTALHLAIAGTEILAQLLVSNGADMHIRNKNGLSALELACERGRLLWLSPNGDMNALVKAMRGHSLLHRAVWCQDKQLIIQCLKEGMDLGAKDATGRTPLDYCVTSCNIDLVKLLVKYIDSHNLSPAIASDAFPYAVANMTCFDHRDAATWMPSVQIGHLLLPFRQAYGPDGFGFAHARVTGHNKTLLILAAETGRAELVEFLLDCGSDVTCQDRYGETACHYAAEVNYPEIVKMLVERGSRLDILDSSKRTPLICALKRGNERVIAYLRGVEARLVPR